jgi:hypothetical protein
MNARKFRLDKTSQTLVFPALDAALPNVTVAGILNDTNRVATRCTPSASAVLAGICWNSGDANTTKWTPQGITTTADASTVATYQDKAAIFVSWYDSAGDGIDKGVRISFIDWTTPSTPRYRHVLLVDPYTRSNGVASFRPVNIHGGGMFLYGHLLYVADTSTGFRVFDMNHLWRVKTSATGAIGWQSDGTYQAFGYKYVLPQTFRYKQTTTGGYARLRFSFAALDRTSTPDSVVVGEWDAAGTGTRLVRWRINDVDRNLTEDPAGGCLGSEAYTVSVQSMQGAASVNGKWYLSTSDGDANKGDLVTFVPVANPVIHPNTLAIGPEDLSYWGPTGALWTATEHPGQRCVYSFRASAF